MKTTVDINDALFEQVRRLVSAEQTTLRALIEERLRKVVLEHTNPRPFKLKDGSFGAGGLQPEMGNATWDQIRDMIYEDREA